ncbi:ribosome hibernation-promoting factor, HPF/YfiA family [Desulfosarcina ovata]|uniref:Ribosome hibernation promoting factor n=1 Tax=Desulfosarcina ovata subsp. ovata TaxID=2752305 RepID=A0A5K8A2Z0_9BACT|nr:ribosome-associated translation inhibitor RaiA [Desulfosarcina ovata]BBO86935.1 ribosomal subunit interface protein [Desulfosarcina ovata subsp. ovata]
MNTSVRFKNLESSEALRTYVSEKLNRLEKYFNGPAEANVVLSIEKFRHSAEINLTGDRLSINGKEETEEMYAAIDMVLDKMEVQIKRSKQKSRTHRSKGKNFATDAAKGTDDSAGQPRVRIHHIEYKPMDVDEAVMQMDLTTDSFLVFTDARTNMVNVLYRQKDGHFGLIQPRP